MKGKIGKMDRIDFQMELEPPIKFLEFNSDAWEIFHEVEVKKAVRIEKGRIKHLVEEREEGVAIRAIVNGRVGFSFTTDANALIDACERAVKITKISEERLNDFPEGGFSRVNGIYGKIEGDWLKEAGEIVISAVEEGVNPAEGVVEVSEIKKKILNSSGAELESNETFVSAFIECVFEEGAAYDLASARDSSIDLEGMAKNASTFAKHSAKGSKIEPGKYDVVLSPLATHQLLFHALYPAFSVENVVKGRSPLANKLDQKIFGEVSLIDDGRKDGLLMSSPFDDEGNATQRTEIVEKGILKDFLKDWKWANEFSADPTGNGIRQERNSYPATLPTNVLIEVEEGKDYGKALYIHSFTGAHTSNPISGDFSLEISPAIYDGMPIKTGMLYGNIYELLKKIEVGGREKVQVENTYTPWLKFLGIEIKG
ncbi:MAG: TldD/PmbA family protein [Archaeoglobus sp.]|nr:TldD/PmbA family protein [Archaeoglobus sp.]